jgi:Family of unknown function (DUF6085)
MLVDHIAAVLAEHRIDNSRTAVPGEPDWGSWDARAWCTCGEFRTKAREDPTAALLEARLHIAEQIVAAIEASQPDHLIEFSADGWIIQHSMACRLNGHLFDCPVNRAAAVGAFANWPDDPNVIGRYRCTLDDDGRLVIGEAVAR